MRALDEARRAIVVLSEAPETLYVSISQTVEDLTARHGMTARLDLAQDIVLNGDATENLLRIIREAITNAARHGHASTVTLRLAQAGDVIRLLIDDNGGGFDDHARCMPSGYGSDLHGRALRLDWREPGRELTARDGDAHRG